MNKIAKIITGICLAVVVMAGINCTAKASTDYYVTSKGVYAVDSKYPYSPRLLAPGSVIPAHSTVYVSSSYSHLGGNDGMFTLTEADKKSHTYSFTTNSWSAVGYNDGAVTFSNATYGVGESVAILPGGTDWGCVNPYYWGYYNPYHWDYNYYEAAIDYAYALAYVAAASQVPCYDWSNACVPAPACQVVGAPTVSVETTNVVYNVCGVDVAMDVPQIVVN